MTRSVLLMLAAFCLSACEKPTVVNVPPVQVAVPGPAGPTGATGSQGKEGRPGDGTTLIVVPPAASAPAPN
jgi:hypothetical protein